MGYFITPDGNYYEGEHVAEGSLVVTRRTDPLTKWDGAQWVPDAALWEASKAVQLNGVRELRERTINRLMGIAARAQRRGDTATASACDAATIVLLNITTNPAVVASVNEGELVLAVKLAYAQAVALLTPEGKTAFKGVDL